MNPPTPPEGAAMKEFKEGERLPENIYLANKSFVPVKWTFCHYELKGVLACPDAFFYAVPIPLSAPSEQAGLTEGEIDALERSQMGAKDRARLFAQARRTAGLERENLQLKSDPTFVVQAAYKLGEDAANATLTAQLAQARDRLSEQWYLLKEAGAALPKSSEPLLDKIIATLKKPAATESTTLMAIERSELEFILKSALDNNQTLNEFATKLGVDTGSLNTERNMLTARLSTLRSAKGAE